MSSLTAFVAVDASRRTEGTQGVTVPVAVPVPEGVDTTQRSMNARVSLSCGARYSESSGGAICSEQPGCPQLQESSVRSPASWQ